MTTPISPARAFCWGVLHAIGRFDVEILTLEERIDCGDERAWFGAGEALMAAMLALTLTVPAGLWFATQTSPALACTGTAAIFLPLFVFLPKLIRYATAADTEAVVIAFGKNEQVKKVFWAAFTALTGLVLAQIAEPGVVEQVIAAVAGG